jgi:hypothetical protein
VPGGTSISFETFHRPYETRGPLTIAPSDQITGLLSNTPTVLKWKILCLLGGFAKKLNRFLGSP